jgi:pimeloyl-ACP methyl ester carboxylesterase
MAGSVIRETGAPAYPELVRRVVRRTPIHLLAGERSAAGWDVPDWVRAAARSSLVIPDTGHMMMLEDPAGFCRRLRAVIEGGSAITQMSRTVARMSCAAPPDCAV